MPEYVRRRLNAAEMRAAARVLDSWPCGITRYWARPAPPSASAPYHLLSANEFAEAVAAERALAEYGCPAVAVAVRREQTTEDGLNEAMRSVEQVYHHRTGGASYIGALRRAPAAVAAFFRLWADEDERNPR